MLQAKALHKTFNPGTVIENHALRGLSLTIDEGEFITVIGSNGAGKSTFLNAISGDLKVDEGQIIIDGQDVTGTGEGLSIEESLAQAWQRGQRRHLLRRAVRASQRALFREKLATLSLGLEARLTDRMGLLSGGQRQAVSLLMASLQPSRLLLLDEHTAALDPKTAAFVLRLTDQIVQSQGLTALMVTHSMRQALDHGTRTVMLHQGQVVLDVRGAERAALDVPDLLAMFSRVRGEAVDDDKLLLG